MKFQLSAKPLSDALAQCIVNANVSKFYRKSCLVQLTADATHIEIVTEASCICSKVVLKGKGDSYTPATIFVDSLLFKQLISTLDAKVIDLEFSDSGLIIHSGKSKFTLPKMIDGEDLSLRSPGLPDVASPAVTIDKSSWKFIKENQMYAIAMSFIHPVYTRVWMSESGDVLVGDFDNSLFTYSKKGNLNTTCLLSDTIINIFVSLPEGAQLFKSGDSFIIMIKTDGYEMISQIEPQYESDEGVGSYHSEIILDMLKHPETNLLKLNTTIINKFLSQADLLSSSGEDTINFEVTDSQLVLRDQNVDCHIDLTDANSDLKYCVKFKTSLLKSVISSYSTDIISVGPLVRDDEVVGVLVWDDDLTTVIAGVD